MDAKGRSQLEVGVSPGWVPIRMVVKGCRGRRSPPVGGQKSKKKKSVGGGFFFSSTKKGVRKRGKFRSGVRGGDQDRRHIAPDPRRTGGGDFKLETTPLELPRLNRSVETGTAFKLQVKH